MNRLSASHLREELYLNAKFVSQDGYRTAHRLRDHSGPLDPHGVCVHTRNAAAEQNDHGGGRKVRHPAQGSDFKTQFHPRSLEHERLLSTASGAGPPRKPLPRLVEAPVVLLVGNLCAGRQRRGQPLADEGNDATKAFKIFLIPVENL